MDERRRRSRTSGSRASRWFAVLLACAALAVHTERSLALFGGWNGLTSRDPIVAVDHALHYYHGVLGARCLRAYARVCGYDPHFMAGYPRTPLFDPSANLAELSQLVLPGPVGYKLFVMAVTWLAPLLVATSAWLLWRSGAAAVLSLWLTVMYWWVGYPNGLLRSGLVAFLWSACVATLLVAVLARHDGRWGMRRWAACAGLAAVGLQSHPTFVLQVACPVLCWVARRAASRAVWWAWTVAAAAVALAISWPWWWPLLVHFPARSAETPFLQASSPWFVVDYFAGWWSYQADAHLPTIALLWAAVALAVRKDLLQGGLGLWFVHLVALALLTFAGSLWEITKSLEPARFQVPFALALIVLAGRGIAELHRLLRPSRLFKEGLAGPMVLAAILGSGWLGLRATLPASRVRLTIDRPLPAGVRPEMRALVRALERLTSPEHRVLLEDQLRLWEATDPESTHWTPLLPLLLNRGFIGGLYELAPLPHRYASFGDRHLAGRPIEEWSPEQLRRYLIRYNIGWVVTWSRSAPGGGPLGATEVFERLPFCRQVAVVPRYSSRAGEDRYTVFAVELPMGWALRGSARVVERTLNRLVLADVVPDQDGQVWLSFHYVPGWRARPSLRVFPVQVGDVPVPFLGLQLTRPEQRIELEYRPQGHWPWMWRGRWRAW